MFPRQPNSQEAELTSADLFLTVIKSMYTTHSLNCSSSFNFNGLNILRLFEGVVAGGRTVEAYLPDKKRREKRGVEIVSVVQRSGETGGVCLGRVGRGLGKGERVTVSSGS